MIRIAEIGSTNDVARALADAGVPEGAVVVAEVQTQGRGRLGRSWFSPEGGLWCSVLLRPQARSAWGRLSLAAAVAASEAIEATVPLRTGIRWPNDVVIGERKACGILIEGTGGAVVVGIGINVNVPVETLPPEVAAHATSLHLAAGHPVDRETILRALLGSLARWYGLWDAGDDAVLEAWRRRDVTRGTHVIVDGPGPRVEGVAVGVDDDGALRVRLESGVVQRVVAGDLTRLSGPGDG